MGHEEIPRTRVSRTMIPALLFPSKKDFALHFRRTIQ